MSRERRSAIAIGVAVFVAGGALLGLEIASSRVLAPFFGNSLYVWGALIGIVLAGLSTGYWLGGVIADRYPKPALLVAVLGVGGLLVLAIPFVDGWVLDRIVDWDPGPRLNPLVATIALFGIPSVVLGDRVTHRRQAAGAVDREPRPHRRSALRALDGRLDRRHVRDRLLADPGARHRPGARLRRRGAPARRSHGRPRRAARGAARAHARAGRRERQRRRLARPGVGRDRRGLAATQLVPGLPPRQATGQLGGLEDTQEGYTVVHTKDSQYHRIAVVDDDESRYLRFDSSFQSGMYLNDPYRTRFGYSDYLQLALAYRPRDEARALRRARRRLGAEADVARLPERPDRRGRAGPRGGRTSPTATSSFRATRASTSRSRTGGASSRATMGRWDTIIVDAFYSDSIPFHLATREFLELARARLAPGGMVVTNIIGAVRGPDSRLFRSMLRTYRAVFPTVSIHPVLDAGGRTWRSSAT